MDGIDTNVLIRYLVKDDPLQYQQAVALLKSLPKIYLSPVVLVETVWVLSHCYQVTLERQCEALRELVGTRNFWVDNRQGTLRAIDDYAKGYDFADAMIGHHNQTNNCGTTWTFDRKASKLAEFSPVIPNN